MRCDSIAMLIKRHTYPASSAPTEFYAAYFSANVTGNEAELALMKEYYPTATSVADSYSNQLAGN